jgi:hypothetical protein
VVLFCPDSQTQRAAISEARRLGTNWERWTLRGDAVTKIKAGTYIQGGSSAAPRIKPLERASAFKATAQEYLALMASAVALRHRYLPALTSHLVSLDGWLREMLDATDIDPVTKQTQLVNVNATLSRQTSQAFAGTSPIPDHECHLWSHSLLGIGTASIALEGIIGFIAKIVQETRIVERIAALATLKPVAEQPWSVSQNHSIWRADYLSAVTLGKPSGDDVRLVTCFSGRDGFRSTDLSICVPLELGRR